MKRKAVFAGFAAFIYAINIVIGTSFKEHGGFGYMFTDKWNLLKGVGAVALYTVLFGILLCLAYTGLERIKVKNESNMSKWKVIGISFCTLLICYGFYLYVYYPGSINSDSVDQLSMYFGFAEMTNHHPFLSTLLIGGCVEFGMFLGNAAVGMFLYVVMQTVIQAFAFAYTLGTMAKWGISSKIIVICGMFYGGMPFWGGYAQLIIKDTLYTAVLVLFVTQFLDLITGIDTEEFPKRKMILLVITGILTALLRNNGIYVVVPCLIGGLFLCKYKKTRFVWLQGLGICVVFYLIWGNVLLPVFNVKDGSIREMLSVPFQQTARYIREYPNEVTEEEKIAINSVLDYDKIGQNYLSYGADPVKNTYKEPKEQTATLGNYFIHWFKMFWKHPTVYMEATIANSYYYYCANMVGSIEPIYVDFIHANETMERLGLAGLEGNAQLRERIDEFSEGFQSVPVLKLLFSEGFYTYILIGLLAYLCYAKRKKYIVGLLPNMIGVMVCIASPVLGSFRYFLPVIGCTCIVFAYCIKCKE